MVEVDRLQAAIAALEAQRSILGDAVVDTAVGPLRERLAALSTQAPSRRHQRRQVTVLFADIFGYTTLSEHVDPERIGLMLSQFWGGVDELVRSRRGRVYSHMGDGIMVVWGDTTSSEDDAEQAVRAGLAMLEMMRAEGLVVAGTRVEAQMRVGVNTGLAHLSDRDGHTAIGDTVNVAARLEGAAAPGSILISRSTFSQVRGLFELADAGQLALKGREQAVQAYRVVRPLPRAFPVRRRGIEGIETDLVGRTEQLELIRQRMHRAIALRELCVTVIVGEPGIGKSRMLAECRDWLETGMNPVRYFEGRCYPDTTLQPFALLRSILFHRFQVSDDDDPTTAMQKIAVGVAGLLGAGAGRIAESLGWLIGLGARSAADARSDGTYRRNAAISDTVDFFTAVSAGQLPMMLFLEDLHWADDASLDLFERLLAGAPAGLTLIGATRPSLLGRRPAWGAERGLHSDQSVLFLEPLDDAAAEHLVDQILSLADEVPPAFRRQLVAQASGNAFHLEELIKMLIDDGVITTGDTWTIDARRVADVRVPDTLVGVLQSRLDHLSAAEFRLLQVASVFGRFFWEDALAAVMTESAEAGAPPVDIDAVFGSLLATELIQRRPTSRFSGTREAEFRHDVLRAVAYDTIPLDDRPRLHRGAARWLAPVAGDRGDEHAVVIAGHLDKAGDRAVAAEWYVRAAQQAAGQALFADALRLYAEVVGRLTDPVRRTDVLLGQIYTMVTAGRHDEAKQLVEPMLKPGSGATTSQQLRARCELARIYGLRDGNFDAAEQLLLDGIALQHLVPDDDPVHHFLEHQLGILQITIGRYAAGAQTLRNVIERPISNAEVQRRGWSINALAYAHAHLGDASRAIELSHEAERIGREHNDPRLVMASVAQRALVALHASDWAAALDLFGQAQQLNRRHGDVEKLATVANYLGQAALGLGDVDGSRGHFSEAADVSARSGVVTERVRALIGLAAVAAHLGHRELATRALGVARRHPAAGGESARLATWMAATYALDTSFADSAAPAQIDLDGALAQLRGALDAPDLQQASRRVPA